MSHVTVLGVKMSDNCEGSNCVLCSTEDSGWRNSEREALSTATGAPHGQ
jgi:hypothetical protein